MLRKQQFISGFNVMYKLNNYQLSQMNLCNGIVL